MVKKRADRRKEKESTHISGVAGRIYTDEYFNMITKGSLESARRVVPIITDALKPNSVIDVGCGYGAWLRAFQENGAQVIKGMDGAYINQSQLLIDLACFTAVDLNEPFEIEGRYDIALCLEVVEHIPFDVSQAVIRALTKAAPVVLFSAAIPGQGGAGHINEQWPQLWQSVFGRHGFRKVDFVRRHIWQESRVEWWYRQNMVLFVSSEMLSQSEVLRAEAERAKGAKFEIVHEDILKHFTSVRGLWKELVRATVRAAKRRIHYPSR